MGRKKTDILAGVGENCQISYTIIDKNCRIGDNTIIEGGKHLEDKETDSYVIKEGIVVLKKGAQSPMRMSLPPRISSPLESKPRM